MDILKESLKRYINGPQAKTINHLKVVDLLDEEYAYFVYDEFYTDLKTMNGKRFTRTSYMIQKNYLSTEKIRPSLVW